MQVANGYKVGHFAIWHRLMVAEYEKVRISFLKVTEQVHNLLIYIGTPLGMWIYRRSAILELVQGY